MANTGQKRPDEPNSSQEILKELQSEVSVEAAPLMQFIVRHATLIMVSVGIFAVVLAGVGSYNLYSSSQLEKMQNELATIVMITDAQKRFIALEEFAKTVPEGVRLATLLELASVAISIEKYDTAINSYAEIAKDGGDDPLAQIAMLNQAEILLRVGKANESLALLEKLELQINSNSKIVMLSILAEAAILANQPERAINAFEELAASTSGAEADFFRYRGKILQDKNKAKNVKSNKDAQSK